MRFDDMVRQLTHHNTTVHVFSDPYAELSHAFHRPTPESPEGVYAFGKSQLLERLRAEWFPTIVTRYPEDDVLDAYVGYLSRTIDKDISGLQ
jgi:hypothetical protein